MTVVVSLPKAPMAFTNAVFVQSTSQYRSGLVKITSGSLTAVFKVQASPELQADQIALNAYHRQILQTSVGSEVNVDPTTCDAKNEHCYSITFTVDALVPKKRFTIKEEDLESTMQSVFCGFPVNRGSSMCVDINGVPIKLNIKAFKVILIGKDGPEFRVNQPLGYITPDTTLDFQATEGNPFFTIVPKSQSSNDKKPGFDADWNFESLGIGGLDEQAATIFRRAFASRLLPAETIEQFHIKHVKGVLLYGPPGTGKTLIARNIGGLFTDNKPEVVNGPSILDKFVGQSEANIRALFEPAIKEYKEKGEKASLHVVIFDEIDSICKQRGSVGGGTGVHDTIVNQILTMIDGVDSPNNILVIGMTNRKDLLDPALLRPGRLEVHIEIGLPDEIGRQQIFNIHTQHLRENGALTDDVDIPLLAKKTTNYAGGEIEGVVKAATSYAISQAITVKDGRLEVKDIARSKFQVTQKQFLQAIEEVVPAYGADSTTLESLRGDIVPHRAYIEMRDSLLPKIRGNPYSVVTCLIDGEPGTGTTAFAADLALQLDAPFTKLIASYHLIGLSENQKVTAIAAAFQEAYKSTNSVLVLDGLEKLIEFVNIGPRFSNAILQVISSCLSQPHPNRDRKLVVLCTSSLPFLNDLGLSRAFNVDVHLDPLTRDQIGEVLQLMNCKDQFIVETTRRPDLIKSLTQEVQTLPQL